mmetsp:Transcript_54476/g.129848  ORF Transcript_54476/g.129848 Transcript_54476/m.129848 type:complete len:362 (-) Transcript_54476:174-1259(-)
MAEEDELKLPPIMKQRSRDLSAERQMKKRETAKELDLKVAQWIEAATGFHKPEEESLQAWLEDGIVLCSLVNTIKPGIVTDFTRDFGGSHASDSIREARKVAQKDENVLKFIRAAIELGVRSVEAFELKDMRDSSGARFRNVTNCLFRLDAAIKATCPDFTGPFLSTSRRDGLTPLTPTKEEQIRNLEGQVAGLQAAKDERIEELETSMTRMQSSKDERIRELEESVTDLQGFRTTGEQRIQELEDLLRTKDARIRDLEDSGGAGSFQDMSSRPIGDADAILSRDCFNSVAAKSSRRPGILVLIFVAAMVVGFGLAELSERLRSVSAPSGRPLAFASPFRLRQPRAASVCGSKQALRRRLS